jgi:hypothetical protein
MNNKDKIVTLRNETNGGAIFSFALLQMKVDTRLDRVYENIFLPMEHQLVHFQI